MKLEIKSTQCVSFEGDKQKVVLNKSKNQLSGNKKPNINSCGRG